MADIIFYCFAFLGVILFTAYFGYSLYCKITRRRAERKKWEEFIDKNKKTIVHAHWVWTGNLGENMFTCSHCGEYARESGKSCFTDPYCWNCGAQMDEKEDEEEE